MRVDGDGEFWLTTLIIGAAIGLIGGIIDQIISDDWSKEAWGETAMSTIENSVSGFVDNTLGKALISGATGAISSAMAGNNEEQIVADAFIASGISLIGDAASLAVGRALVGKFINEGSKTRRKSFANFLGYDGRKFKEPSAWSGKIMFDASKQFLQEKASKYTEKGFSFIGPRIWNYLSPW